jgi:hypothetical protein
VPADIVDFSDSVMHSDDLIRRLGNKFEINKNGKSAKKKVDPKILRVISHIKKHINKK